MRLLSSVTLTTMLTISAATAQTTMCFKENHKDMTTIEKTALDGGACEGQNSLADMKNAGWEVEDIKITPTDNGSNYIYILKKDEKIVSSSIDEEALEQKILKRLEERKKQEIEIKKKEIYARKSKSGEKLFKTKCASCHGDKGELKAKGISRPINSLNLDDFALSIRDYNNGTYDRGMAFVMRPYANLMTDTDVNNVYVYLRSLKEKKEEPKK